MRTPVLSRYADLQRRHQAHVDRDCPQARAHAWALRLLERAAHAEQLEVETGEHAPSRYVAMRRKERTTTSTIARPRRSVARP